MFQPLTKEEIETIKEFLRWLDEHGFSFEIIEDIEEKLLGWQKKGGEENE